MSNQGYLQESKNHEISSSIKLQTSFTMDSIAMTERLRNINAYTSRKSSQTEKENSADYTLEKVNSLIPNQYLKSKTKPLCKPLATVHQQTRTAPSFNVHPNTARNSNNSNINNFVTKSIDFSKKSPEIIYKEHLLQTFRALQFIRTLPDPEIEEINSKKIYLPKRKGYENKRTIIFDLDETLVHCIETPELGDFSISINIGCDKIIKAGINIRPYVKEVLASANKDFEVIVFTASSKCYADEVMNYLDPTNELIHHRLYRENCIFKSGVYIKDLRIFANRRIEDIVIVDNSTYCFGYQIDNGIPIISWFDDAYDRELYKLIDYIKILAKVPDISLVNRNSFHLNSFYADYLQDYLNYQDRDININ